MKLIKIMITLFFLSGSIFASYGEQASKAKWKVDPSLSKVKWTGKKLGGSHWGYVKIKKGHLNFSGTDLVGGTFTLDMTSIDVQDIKDKKKNGDLRGHPS